MLLRDFFVEGYREVESKFVASGADINSVKKTLDQFRNLVNKNQIQDYKDEKGKIQNIRNIDWWGKNKTFDEFSKFINDKMQVPTATQVKRSKVPGKSINLIENDQWLVVIPLDKDASCFHGKGSNWCTTKRHQSHFESYFYRREIILIYCLNKQSGGMWAIAGHRDLSEFEMFDQQDNSIGVAQFKQETGLDPQQILQTAIKKHGDPIAATQEEFQDKDAELSERLYGFYDNVKRDSEIEKLLIYTKSGKNSFDYVQTLAENNIPVDDIAVEILIAATGYSWTTIKYLKKPKERVIEAALHGGINKALEYVIDDLGIFPPTDRMIQSFLTNDIDTPIDGEILLLRSYNIDISEKVVINIVKHNISVVYNLLHRGYTVPDEYQIKYIHYHDEKYNWSDYSAKMFKNSSDDVKAAVLELYPGALEFFENPSERLRLISYKRNPYMLEYGAWHGAFPSKEEQQALWDGGFDDTNTKTYIDRIVYSLTSRIENNKIDFKNDIKNIEIEKEKINVLKKESEDTEWTKVPGIDVEKIMKIYQKMIEDIETKIKNIKELANNKKYWIDEYQKRLNSLQHGIENIGYLSEFNKSKYER